MSEAVLSGSTEKPLLSVRGSLLIGLYSVIPLLLLLVFVDKLWLNHLLRDRLLPRDPSDLIIWAIIFGFPHIVSSIVTLADREYLSFYRKKLLLGLAIISAAVLAVNVLVPLVLPAQYSGLAFNLFFVFYAVYTMNHVLSQQFGIGMMMMRANRDWPYACWRWAAIVAASAMYLIVYGRGLLEQSTLLGYSTYELANNLAYVAVAVAIALGFYQTRQSKNELGSWYIYSNIIMILVAGLFLKLEYYAFVVVVPRFVHDITAFMIYSVHDENRNRDRANAPNIIYRALKFLPLSPILLCFPLALLLANGIECGSFMFDTSLGFSGSLNSNCFVKEFYNPAANNGLPGSMKLWMQILFITGFFHYYIESFVWRRESIHRHSVKFAV